MGTQKSKWETYPGASGWTSVQGRNCDKLKSLGVILPYRTKENPGRNFPMSTFSIYRLRYVLIPTHSLSNSFILYVAKPTIRSSGTRQTTTVREP